LTGQQGRGLTLCIVGVGTRRHTGFSFKKQNKNKATQRNASIPFAEEQGAIDTPEWR